MNDRLRGDHAVEQLAARITGTRDDGAIGYSRQRRRTRWSESPARMELSLARLTAAFEGSRWTPACQFDVCDDRYQHGACQGQDLARDDGLAVTKMESDVGVEQEGQRSEPGSFRQLL